MSLREQVAEIVDHGLFAAFESGWFDNTGDIGDGWSEVKDDLIVEMRAKLCALIDREQGATYCPTCNRMLEGNGDCPKCSPSE